MNHDQMTTIITITYVVILGAVLLLFGIGSAVAFFAGGMVVLLLMGSLIGLARRTTGQPATK